MTFSDRPTLWAVVMAGGAGTRFWPLSRRNRPKQLLPFAGGRSLLAASVERLPPLVPFERVVIVTNAEVADAVRLEVPEVPAENVLVEPVGRDTAACVGFATWWLARRHPGAVLVALPADHLVPESAALRMALAAAAATALARGGVVTLGLRPTRPETGFGYVEVGEHVGDAGGLPVHRVARFVEKPRLDAAERMLATGAFRWNSGMFAFTVEAIEGAIRRHLPDLAAGLDMIFASDVDLDAALVAHYPALPRVSLDRGVMEKADPVWVVPVEFAWSDVGSWPGLAEAVGAEGENVTLGEVVSLDAQGSVLISDGPLVAAVGVADIVVVATRDAVLVVPKRDAQRVKELVERLRAAGRNDVL
jgi:mannose-1-phosphate guanylyltransferase